MKIIHSGRVMQENTSKITRTLCDPQRLVFYPETGEEAKLIQRKLFAMGYGWSKSGAVIGNVDECVAKGMVLKNGKLYTEPSEESRRIGLLCTGAQFDENYLSPDQEFMLQQFNKLSAKIETLEAKIEVLNEELHPKTLDKHPLFPPQRKKLEK
jgi:hypothetical protein